MAPNITEDEKLALQKCNAWENIYCPCKHQATHDDQGFRLRGQPFFTAHCMDCLPESVKERLKPKETKETLAARAAIFEAIEEERARQNKKWGGLEHDKTHTVSDWTRFIHEHTHKANSAANQGDIKQAKARLIEVAALAVAGLEVLETIGTYSKWESKK